MSFQISSSPPSQAETFDGLAEMKALKARFGCYDERLNALLDEAIARFVVAFGDDDWQAKVAPTWVKGPVRRKLVTG